MGHEMGGTPAWALARLYIAPNQGAERSEATEQDFRSIEQLRDLR